jgi:N-acylneuraminate cytidylyltransferase
MSVTALIPARGRSRGLPGKNLAAVGGRTLVARAVEVGRAVELIDEVAVSSDDAAILAEAGWAGAVSVARPAALAADDTPTAAVVDHFLAARPAVDTLVLLQPTSPLRNPDDVRRCLAALASAPAAATVTPVAHPIEWTFREGGDGRLAPVLGWRRFVARRQDALRTFTLNGAVYAASAAYLRAGHPLVGPDTAMVPMPPERSVDVDDEVGLALARLLCDRVTA